MLLATMPKHRQQLVNETIRPNKSQMSSNNITTHTLDVYCCSTLTLTGLDPLPWQVSL
jgi:hypothetical protein